MSPICALQLLIVTVACTKPVIVTGFVGAQR
jgi:hypothetical protein